MIDVFTFAKGMKTTWVKLFTDDYHRPFKLLFNMALRKYGGAFLFNCNFARGDVCTTSSFINQICDAWAEFNYSVPELEFSNQIVLNNSQIKINNKMVYSNALRMQNAYLVSSFFAEDGTILSYNDFIRRHGIKAFPFTFYFGIISALPMRWKRNVTFCEIPNENALKLLKFISVPRPSNYLYNVLLKRKVSTPTAVARWQQLANENTQFRWNKIYTLPYVAVRDKKLQYFQFRFIHRILGVNEFLFKIKLIDSPLCSFCVNENETIDHLFWHCPIVAAFWKDVCTFCLKKPFSMSLNLARFGFLEDLKHPINFFILQVKYFIFTCKVIGTDLSLLSFSYKFKSCLEIENFILQKKRLFSQITHFRELFVYDLRSFPSIE